ncbi:MAG TPA: ABC transporter substrate-binding protein [Acidimicrobiales bacterium]|nr:ABC transporter substrate-binding protein [Acidimicrobiales bacterium]
MTKIRGLAAITALSLSGTFFTGIVTASSASAAASPITVGFISDLTGVASSTFADSAGGIRARFDLQNAHGGVNGHKLRLIVEDDQSSPTTYLTAAEDLVSNKHAQIVVSDSSFTYGGARYLNQQGIPVIGAGFDGTEWTTYDNMFSWLVLEDSPIKGVYYSDNGNGRLLKSVGVTKLAGLGYGIGFSSPESIRATFAGAAPLGVRNCYENLSVPFGGVDFTADVLQIKNAGCNGVVGSFVDTSDVALSQAVKNAGLNAKQLYFTGYDQSVLDSASAKAAMEGDYFRAQVNYTSPNAATRAMMNTLKKYDPSYSGGIPDFGLQVAYLGADLAIQGLRVSGKNPTAQSIIAHMRKIKAYDAGGILPGPTPMTGFGTPNLVPKKVCNYYMQLQNGQFHVVGGKAVCGSRIVAPTP